VTGVPSSDNAFAVYSFVYLHSKPLSEIRRRIAVIDDLRADIYDFMDARPVEDMFAFLPWITSQMEHVAATITASAPGAGAADPKA
jgi:hypothetical protein